VSSPEVDTTDTPENADMAAESDESTVEPEQSTVEQESDESTVDAESAVPEEPVSPEESTVDDDAPTLDLVDTERLRNAVEAVLLVVDQPVDVTTLAQTLNVPKPDVQTALETLRAEYDEGNRGIDLRELAGGWRLYSRDDYAAYVERFVLDGQQTRLTQAALETLSVIAYRQPVTRARVSAVRGVGVDAVIRTLTTRGLIEECGTDVETGGGLYRTTPLFLEKLGLKSLEDLPPLAPLLPDHTELDSADIA
jgi:segregation and condensation protein B